jgi:hypothetical protein
MLSYIRHRNRGEFTIDCRDLKYLVLQEAVQNGLQRYVSKKLDEHPILPPNTQSDLLHCALLPAHGRPVSSAPRLRMLALLLEKGCDPNASCGEETAWTSFLEDECTLVQSGNSSESNDVFLMIKDLLEHGADDIANCSLGTGLFPIPEVSIVVSIFWVSVSILVSLKKYRYLNDIISISNKIFKFIKSF